MSEENVFLVGPVTGTRPLVETLVGQLATTRHYLLSAVRDLCANELDSRPAGCRNTVGEILAHIAAAETMFQNITFEGRQFGETESELRRAFRFEENFLEGNDLGPYRERLSAVRLRTRSLFGGKGDSWLAEPMTFSGLPSNKHYYWTHFMLDEARHTGQISLIRKHLLPGSDPEFDPYAGP